MTPDPTQEPIDLYDPTGRVLYFSCDRFLRDIAQGDCCFICGAKPGSKDFNDEHVLPDWIIRRFGLEQEKQGLPNQEDASLFRYVVPCCKDCNDHLADFFENRMSPKQAKGLEVFKQAQLQDRGLRLFNWLALIFFKQHYRDKTNALRPDEPDGAKVADLYAWQELHHLHCLARMFYTGCRLDPRALGTLLILRARVGPNLPDYDYKDFSRAQAMLLRLGEIALFAVFNDCGEAGRFLKPLLDSLTEPLAPVQLREVLAMLADVNLRILRRPRFSTQVVGNPGYFYITTDDSGPFPQAPPDPRGFGSLLYECVADLLPQLLGVNEPELVKAGRISYLWQPDGSFNAQEQLERPKEDEQ